VPTQRNFELRTANFARAHPTNKKTPATKIPHFACATLPNSSLFDTIHCRTRARNKIKFLSVYNHGTINCNTSGSSLYGYAHLALLAYTPLCPFPLQRRRIQILVPILFTNSCILAYTSATMNSNKGTFN
jgi:hypothetical protein